RFSRGIGARRWAFAFFQRRTVVRRIRRTASGTKIVVSEIQILRVNASPVRGIFTILIFNDLERELCPSLFKPHHHIVSHPRSVVDLLVTTDARIETEAINGNEFST